MDILEEIRELTIDSDIKALEGKVRQALDSGIPARTILNDGLIAGMTDVGCMFEEGEYFVPDMLLASRAMKAALAILEPNFSPGEVEPIARVAVGSVKGDLHDIGKSLVATMLQGSGFEIIDLGIDVQPEQFIEQINKGTEFIAISALLTTTMRNMESTIKAINEAGVRHKVKILVGGAPVTQEYADSIGADGFAPDAIAAVEVAKGLLNSA